MQLHASKKRGQQKNIRQQKNEVTGNNKMKLKLIYEIC